MALAVPILDLSKGSDAAFADAFADAYGTLGFAQITGHGVAPALRSAVFAASRAFHVLPLATKMQVALDANHRGYIAIDTSTDVNSQFAEVTRPNQSESFMMMRDEPQNPARFLSGPNRWPAVAGFRPALEAYAAAMEKLGTRLTRIAAAAAGIDARGIDPLFTRPTIWLRLLHYPSLPDGAPADLYGSAPHTDFGALTLLAQDPVGGLEVLSPEGDWLAVPFIADAFVVNVGDMLHRLSNGRLRSTPHRVINRSGRERWSVAFFFDPDVTATIAPLPGTGTARFDPIRFDTFLRAELGASYQAHSATT